VVSVRVPGLSQTVATPQNGSARKAAVRRASSVGWQSRGFCAESAILAGSTGLYVSHHRT